MTAKLIEMANEIEELQVHFDFVQQILKSQSKEQVTTIKVKFSLTSLVLIREHLRF